MDTSHLSATVVARVRQEFVTTREEIAQAVGDPTADLAQSHAPTRIADMQSG